MVEKIHDAPAIYRTRIPLPNNPLKELNSYVLPDADRPLIIDTGFNRPECLSALLDGLHELSVDLTKTDLFLTHLHGDHTGLAVKLAERGCTIFMNPDDHNYFESMRSGIAVEYLDELFINEGFPKAEVDQQGTQNQARLYMTESSYDIIPVEDGVMPILAGHTFTAITTPGHTPGHTCLYLPGKELMFLGDHVLFDITPNITVWKGVDDSLGNYLDSLKRIAAFPAHLALPGHRGNQMDFLTRIEQIQNHHQQRLNETLQIIAAEPKLTAYEITARMTWSMRGKTWREFPVGQKWFATGESLAHLHYLLKRGLIIRDTHDGHGIYVINYGASGGVVPYVHKGI